MFDLKKIHTINYIYIFYVYFLTGHKSEAKESEAAFTQNPPVLSQSVRLRLLMIQWDDTVRWHSEMTQWDDTVRWHTEMTSWMIQWDDTVRWNIGMTSHHWGHRCASQWLIRRRRTLEKQRPGIPWRASWILWRSGSEGQTVEMADALGPSAWGASRTHMGRIMVSLY